MKLKWQESLHMEEWDKTYLSFWPQSTPKNIFHNVTSTHKYMRYISIYLKYIWNIYLKKFNDMITLTLCDALWYYFMTYKQRMIQKWKTLLNNANEFGLHPEHTGNHWRIFRRMPWWTCILERRAILWSMDLSGWIRLQDWLNEVR